MTGGAANRRKGDTFERATAKWLRLRGFYVVRSAGSLGVADLVALRSDNVPLLISCKYDGKIPPLEWSNLFDTATDAGPRYGYVHTRARARGEVHGYDWLNNLPPVGPDETPRLPVTGP
jgi:hypothetical protein